MFPQSKFSKLVLSAATGVLLAAMSAGTAVAADAPGLGHHHRRRHHSCRPLRHGRGDHGRDREQGRGQGDEHRFAPDAGPARRAAYADGRRHRRRPRRVYRGCVRARRGVFVHRRPSQRSPIIGSLRHGRRVLIFCKVRRERVHGNPIWYRLSNPGPAWASARFIRPLGRSPRRC